MDKTRESANILIIEDEMFEAEHLKLHLLQSGHHVVDVVATGEDAVARARMGGIDLMIVDIVLAGKMDGIDAVAEIRQTQDIPAIFLTAHVSDELLMRAERSRPFAYLLKPYRLKELEFMVNMSLARVRVERELLQQKKLAESDLHQAHNVIHYTNEGIIITNREDEIVFVNPAFTRITGYEAAEAVGQKTSFLRSSKHKSGFYADMWQAINEHDHWQGEIWNRRKNGEVFPIWMTINPIYDSVGELVQYVGIFTDITSVKQAEAELDHLAHHDPLTDLPNRLLFMTRLSYSLRSASRNKQMCAVLYVDLDRFKLINDSLGHDVGDGVLQAVAQRFKRQIRDSDMIARLGGDEFVMLLDGIENPLDASLIADKIINSLESPLIVGDHEFVLTCSIGIATFPRDGNTVEDLLRDADSAMYQAKKSGQNNIVFYSEDMTQKAYKRIKLYSDLRLALRHQQFELYFQPQIDMQTGKLQGAEALIRWNHPSNGFTGPMSFIQEAEESGLILPIGEWVLQEACRCMQDWLQLGIDCKRISVNVAGPQLQRGNLVAVVKNALNKSSLPANRLELELTETYAMELLESHVDTLHSLHNMGVTISIDDFGTGTSSLSRLKKLNINKLKIDRSFVMDIPQDKDDEAITRAVIAMGKSLGLSIIAEGVETKEQEQFLLSEGCVLAQGYLYSKPLSRADFESFALSLGNLAPPAS